MFFAGFTNLFRHSDIWKRRRGSQDDYLGNVGVPRGANHLFVNGSNIYVGTTTHSVSHTPAESGGGFPLTTNQCILGTFYFK